MPAVIATHQYFPCIGLVYLVWKNKQIIFERCENYQKGSFRNRTIIRAANGPLHLSIPLEKGKHQSTPITEVRIAHGPAWRATHWKSIRSAYGSAPYFEHYGPELKRLLTKSNERLIDLLRSTEAWVFEKLQLTNIIHRETSTFIRDYDRQSHMDTRVSLSPKVNTSKIEVGISQSVADYPSVFNYVAPNIAKISSIDLIMHMGPAATTIFT